MMINELNYYDINNAEINVVSKKCKKDWIFLEKVSGLVWSARRWQYANTVFISIYLFFLLPNYFT